MTYVQGIGDEVLLFFTFVIASFGIILFLFLRELFSRADARQGGHTDDLQPPSSTPGNESLQATGDTSTSSLEPLFQQRTPVSNSDNPSRLRGTTENVTEATDSTASRIDAVFTYDNQPVITLRLVLQERTINVQVPLSTTLQELKRQHLQRQLTAGNRIRFISHGQVYEDDTITLQDCGVTDNSALHVHISEPRTNPEDTQNEELDLSRLFVPLLGLILGLCWLALIYRPVLFTTLAKCLLYILSLIWVVICFNTYSRATTER